VGSSTTAPSTFTHGFGVLAAGTAAAAAYDPNTATTLKGIAEWCRKQLNGALNCCDFGGILNGVLSCNQQEQDLAVANGDKRIHYVGKYCSASTGFPKICVEDKWGFCVFQSLLARLIQEQGRSQLGISWGSPQSPACQGLTMAQFLAIDFSQIDFSEFIATVTVPPPDAAAATSAVQGNAQTQTFP
jgi:conjugal transfer mating pair stabilization protein TraN